MHLPLLFILVLSTVYTSSAAPPPTCDSGIPVCCDGDLIAEDLGVLLGCDPYNEKNVKCERASMQHCCTHIISGVGLGCGKTAARECPVPGFEVRKRHLRQRAVDGCSPPIKQSQANMDYAVADLPLNLNGDDSSDMFLADGASPDISSTDQSLWSLNPSDDESTTASLGGGELSASNYGDGTLSLGPYDNAPGGSINEGPNMFLNG